MNGSLRYAFTRAAVGVLLLMCCSRVTGKVIYVDDDASGLEDGTSWATAYKYLQDALAEARATDEATEVRVAQGIYRPDRSTAEPNGTGDRRASFDLFSDLALVGGYAGWGTPEPNDRDPHLYETILSGDLAGNDVAVDDPCDLRNEPTRSENSTNITEILDASNVRVDGFTIRNGQADIIGHDTPLPTSYDAGLRADGLDSFTLKDCVFVDNCAIGGTAACTVVDCTDVVLDGCSFVHNWRGGLGISDSTGRVSECYVIGNVGGMGILRGDITVTDCIIENNMQDRDGGGLTLKGGEVRLERCSFVGNRCEAVYGYGGGAVYAYYYGTYTFVDCGFHGNVSAAGGGGISVQSIVTLTLRNCVFSGNRSECGGAIHMARTYTGSSARLEVVNCTVLNNRATHGRFLCCEADPPHTIAGRVWISNSVIADGGNEVTTDDAKIWLDHSLLSIEPGSIIDPGNNVTFGPGNISGDPCAVDPGYWSASGTVDDANDDFFVVGDYHLKSQAGRWDETADRWVMDEVTSVCIDAGDPMSPIGIEPFPNGGRVNMGAYGGTDQASKSYFGGPPCEIIIPGDINGDCKVDGVDFALLAQRWMEAWQ